MRRGERQELAKLLLSKNWGAPPPAFDDAAFAHRLGQIIATSTTRARPKLPRRRRGTRASEAVLGRDLSAVCANFGRTSA
jgi:hypothetical protein